MTLAYDARGLLTSKTVGASQDAYGYDGLGRMTYAKRGTTANDDAISETTFAYDTRSRLTQETQELFEDNSRTMAYNYDQAGNRDEFQYDLSPAVTLAYEVDEGNRVTQVDRKIGAGSYNDLIGRSCKNPFSQAFLPGRQEQWPAASVPPPLSSCSLLTTHYSLLTVHRSLARFDPTLARPGCRADHPARSILEGRLPPAEEVRL